MSGKNPSGTHIVGGGGAGGGGGTARGAAAGRGVEGGTGAAGGGAAAAAGATGVAATHGVGAAGGGGGVAVYHRTSLRCRRCAISMRSDRAGFTQRLAGYSRSSRRIVSTAPDASCAWSRLCANQNSASSLLVSFGSATAAFNWSIARTHCSSAIRSFACSIRLDSTARACANWGSRAAARIIAAPIRQVLIARLYPSCSLRTRSQSCRRHDIHFLNQIPTANQPLELRQRRGVCSIRQRCLQQHELEISHHGGDGIEPAVLRRKPIQARVAEQRCRQLAFVSPIGGSLV